MHAPPLLLVQIDVSVPDWVTWAACLSKAFVSRFAGDFIVFYRFFQDLTQNTLEAKWKIMVNKVMALVCNIITKL